MYQLWGSNQREKASQYTKQNKEKYQSNAGKKTEKKFDTRKAINQIQESLAKVLKASKRKDVKLKGYSDEDDSSDGSDDDQVF